MFLAPLSLRIFGALSILALALTPADLKLKPNEHKTFSKLVSDYFTAFDEQKGIQEKLQKFIDLIETTDKRLKNQQILSSVSDWEEVFRLVTAERLKQTIKIKKGEVAIAKVKHHTGRDVVFAYCLPKTYSTKSVLPLILTVPDAGEDPSAHLNAHWNDAAIREGAILVAVQMGQDSKVWGTFGSPEAPGGAFTVMFALGVVQREFAVDCNRTFLAGAGEGFSAAEATAGAFPHCYAGVIGIGNVSSGSPANLGNFRNLPTLLLKGGEGAKAIESKIAELGFGNCSVLPEGGVAEVWAWIGKTVRQAYPAQISFAPTSDYARRTHWISLEGVQVSENPRIDAKVDRAANTITIDAQKVSDLVIYLNDVLVDLDKPVRFLVNGTTQEQTVARNGVEMVKNQYAGGDWGRVFTCYVTQNIP